MGISRVAGPAEESTIEWAARGTSARGQDLHPYERPSWLVPLSGYTRLSRAITRENIGARKSQILAVRAQLKSEWYDPIHFPYYLYGEDQLRTLQACLALYPRDLLALFPDLQAQVAAFESGNPSLVAAPPQDPPDPDLYLANEAVTVAGHTTTVDGKAITTATQTRARLQNELREHVLDAGGSLTQAPAGVKADRSWHDASGALFICEVKSLPSGRETHQLRYGLGQLIDYIDRAAHEGDENPTPILFVERPPAIPGWSRKCDWAGVQLCWPGRWPG